MNVLPIVRTFTFPEEIVAVFWVWMNDTEEFISKVVPFCTPRRI